jgi:outer membrane protein
MRTFSASLLVIAAALVGLVAPAAAQEAPKLSIAVIDVQLLVQDSAAGKEAMNRLRTLENEKQAQGRKMAEDKQALEKQLQTQGATLSDVKRAELAKQIEDKDVELRRFADDAAQALEEAKRKELQKLEQQIMPVIQEIGREQKFTMIFNKYQSGLVYADETFDITEQVLRRFNTKVTTK